MEEFGIHIRNSFSLRHLLVELFYSIILATLIALFLTITVFRGTFIINWIISLSFGVTIYLIIHFLLWVFKPEKIPSLVFIIIIGVGCGTLVGLQIGPFVIQKLFSVVVMHQGKDVLQTIIFALVFGCAASYFFYSKAKIKVGKEEIQQERIMRLSKEKEALEANLKLLQAQIEPHFLFNTLSNIMSLIDTNPNQSKAMLADLIHYLRTSLSRTRHDLITLNQEIEIVKAYLNILKIRMGERLHFRIELPDDLKEHPFPPMLLQPLVENAVKHGIEPKIEGGEILIKIQEKDGLIRSEIMDSGIGLTSYTEAGVGMGNVRERLRMLYGEKGRLLIEENKPSGVKAIIDIPKEGGDQK
jgi:sensor histidine kinase YesM